MNPSSQIYCNLYTHSYFQRYLWTYVCFILRKKQYWKLQSAINILVLWNYFCLYSITFPAMLNVFIFCRMFLLWETEAEKQWSKEKHMTSFQALEKLLNPCFQSQSVPRMRAHWYINVILPPENISFTDNMEDYFSV